MAGIRDSGQNSRRPPCLRAASDEWADIPRLVPAAVFRPRPVIPDEFPAEWTIHKPSSAGATNRSGMTWRIPAEPKKGPPQTALSTPTTHAQSRESGTSTQKIAADQSVAGGDCCGSSRPAQNYFGIRTVSMTWMTPLSQMMSAVTTVAPPTWTLPSATLISTDWPFTVAADVIFITSAARCLPAMT